MKLLLEKWRKLTRESVIDFEKYRARKEKENMRDIVMISADGQMIYDPRDFQLVIVDTPEQQQALEEGDLEKAVQLGAQIQTVIDEEEWGY
tara:strand:+ start:66 stop:338 length:273 start_codon:yes stop_codon:yes gene_type:complete